MQILDLRLPMLAGDEIVDHSGLERTGSEQGNQSDDVVEAIRLQAPDEVFHPARFELEYRGRRAASNEFVRGRIAGGLALEIQLGAAGGRVVAR